MNCEGAINNSRVGTVYAGKALVRSSWARPTNGSNRPTNGVINNEGRATFAYPLRAEAEGKRRGTKTLPSVARRAL